MIKENIAKINAQLTEKVTLVAVSKTKPAAQIEEAYQAGQRHFGENKVQELVEKHQKLPNDISWHMIGHLQRNKVKYIAPFIALIHSVDSLRLLKEINKQGQKNNRTINCLLQFHIAVETTKFGFSKDEILPIINSEEFRSLNHINVVGIMGMASNTSDETILANEFESLKSIFDHLKLILSNNSNFNCLSMGMSGDYKLAIKKGSTMVRIGSTIFGKR